MKLNCIKEVWKLKVYRKLGSQKGYARVITALTLMFAIELSQILKRSFKYLTS